MHLVIALVGGSVVGLIAFRKWKARNDARTMWAKGDHYVELARAATDDKTARDNYDLARETYIKALGLKKGDTNGLVKLGDLFHERFRVQAEGERYEWQDIQTWERVLEIDPRHPEALRRLFDAYVELAEIQPSVEFYNRVRDKAQALSAVEPDNARAKAYEPIAVVNTWLLGAPLSDADVRDTVDKLKRLLVEQKSEEIMVPWTIAQANFRMAQERQAAGDREGADRLRKETGEMFEQAVKAMPTDDAHRAKAAALAFKHFRVVFALAGVQQAMATTRPASAVLDDPKLAELQDMLDQVIAQARPEDPDYIEILITRAQLLEQRGKRKDAVATMERLLEAHPENQLVRQRLALFYRSDAATRAKAVKILSQPVVVDKNNQGFRALFRHQMEAMRLADLASAQLDLWADTPAAERPALRASIEDNFNKASASWQEPDHPILLKLKGRILLLDGMANAYKAVEVYEQALARLDTRKATDNELMRELVLLYARLGQNVQYRKMLERYVAATNDRQARKELISSLINEEKYQEAEQRLAQAEQFNKDDSDLPRLRVRLLLAQKKKDEAKKLALSLPRQNLTDLLFVSAALAEADDLDSAIALLQPASKSELDPAAAPGASTPASELIIRYLMRQDKKPEAAAVADAILARKPNDIGAKRLAAWAHGKATPDQEIIESISDPAQKQLATAELLRRQGKPDEAMRALQDGEKQFGGKVFAESIFDLAIEQKQLPVAVEYEAKLRQIDPDQSGGLYYKARLQLAQNDRKGALASATELSRRMGGIARTWAVLGQAQQANGDIEGAITSYGKALENQTNNPEALRGMVECYIQTRNAEKLRTYLEKGLALQGPARNFFVERGKEFQELYDPVSITPFREKDWKDKPDELDAWVALAHNYLTVGDFYAAKKDPKSEEFRVKGRDILTQAMAPQKWPDEAQLYRRMAVSWLRSDEPEKGLKVLQDFAARPNSKDRPDADLFLAMYYRQAYGDKKLAEAEQHLRTALTKSKNDPIVRQQLANFLLDTGQNTLGLAELQKLMDETNDYSARIRFVEIQITLGNVAEADKAIAAGLKALESAPTETESQQASVRFRRASLLTLDGKSKWRRDSKNLGPAVESFGRAIQADQNHAGAHYFLGLAKRTQGDFKAAIAELTAARKADDRWLEPRVALANLYRVQSKTNEAVNELEVALQQAPNNAQIRLLLIQLYSDQERWPAVEKAIADARAADAAAGINNNTWLKAEGRMWARRKDQPKAMAAIQKANQIDRNDLEVWYDLLNMMLDMKQYDSAIAASDQLLADIAKDPKKRAAWWLHSTRAIAFKKKDKTDAAIAAFDAALQAVDEANSDIAAETVVRLMVINLGSDETVKRLTQRSDPRWNIELTTVYSAAQQWPRVVKALDDLLAPATFAAMKPGQQIRVLQLGAQLYAAAAASGDPAVYDKGIETCRRYVKEMEQRNRSVAEHLDALNNLAYLLAEHPTKPDTQQALKYSTQAYELMQSTELYYAAVADTHAWVLVKCDDVNQGTELLMQTVRKENPPPDAFFHLGWTLLEKANKPDDALKQLEEAVKRIRETKEKGGYVDATLEARAKDSLEKAKKSVKPGAASAAP